MRSAFGSSLPLSAALAIAMPTGCAALLGVDDWDGSQPGTGAGTSTASGGGGASTTSSSGGAGPGGAGGVDPGGGGGGNGGRGTGGSNAGGMNTGGTDDVCGDGLVTGGEQCDDGSPDGTDGCDQCQVTCQTKAGDGAQTVVFLDPTSKHCYRVESPGGGDWDSRRTDCQIWNGDLVTITSAAENQAVKTLLTAVGNSLTVWIGLNDVDNEGQPVWAETGLGTAAYDQLDPANTPATNCALFVQDSGGWLMSTCMSLEMAVCERHPGLP